MAGLLSSLAKLHVIAFLVWLLRWCLWIMLLLRKLHVPGSSIISSYIAFYVSLGRSREATRWSSRKRIISEASQGCPSTLFAHKRKEVHPSNFRRLLLACRTTTESWVRVASSISHWHHLEWKSHLTALNATSLPDGNIVSIISSNYPLLMLGETKTPVLWMIVGYSRRLEWRDFWLLSAIDAASHRKQAKPLKKSLR